MRDPLSSDKALRPLFKFINATSRLRRVFGNVADIPEREEWHGWRAGMEACRRTTVRRRESDEQAHERSDPCTSGMTFKRERSGEGRATAQERRRR